MTKPPQKPVVACFDDEFHLARVAETAKAEDVFYLNQNTMHAGDAIAIQWPAKPFEGLLVDLDDLLPIHDQARNFN